MKIQISSYKDIPDVTGVTRILVWDLSAGNYADHDDDGEVKRFWNAFKIGSDLSWKLKRFQD